jgi:serine protease
LRYQNGVNTRDSAGEAAYCFPIGFVKKGNLKMFDFIHIRHQWPEMRLRHGRYERGTLKADRFTVQRDERFVVISGGGNVEYGLGSYDCLDLSDRSISSIKAWCPAEYRGIIHNPGNGDRIFDLLVLDNGSQILFEGLDIVEFSDAVLILANDPNDPQFMSQWNLHMMGVHNVWRFTRGSSRVLIGVQDTGLGYNVAERGFHPQIHSESTLCLNNNNNLSDDFIRILDSDRAPIHESDSHGTCVHSIISAISNDGCGMSGINWRSMAFHIDVLDKNQGDLSLAQATQKMLNWANVSQQRLIVNLSLGGGVIDPDFEALVDCHQDSALFVVAAGNQGRSWIDNPAILAQRYDNVIAVGASWGLEDCNGNAVNPGDRAHYSNYGKGLSLMGPTEVIAAASVGALGHSQQFTSKQKFNGTSAAAPNVAGVASLVWSIYPQLSAVEVHKIMAETAYDIGVKGYDLETGHGFVDADAAVRRAMAMAIARSPSAIPPWEICDSRKIQPNALKTLKAKRMVTSYELLLMMQGVVTAEDLASWLAL